MSVRACTHKSRLFGNRGLPQTTVCELRQMLRRSSAAVATSREGHRSPRSGRAGRHRCRLLRDMSLLLAQSGQIESSVKRPLSEAKRTSISCPKPIPANLRMRTRPLRLSGQRAHADELASGEVVTGPLWTCLRRTFGRRVDDRAVKIDIYVSAYYRLT
jgi:hypothetical protein